MMTLFAVGFEKTLGTIAMNSLRKPKQIMQLKRSPTDTDLQKANEMSSRLSAKKVLRTIEKLYGLLMRIDALHRQWNQTEDKTPDKQANMFAIYLINGY